LQAALFDLRATIDVQLGRDSLASYTSQRATELRAQLGWSRGEPVASEDNAMPRATVTVDLYDRNAIGVTLSLPGDRRDYPHQTAEDNSLVGAVLGFDPGSGSGPAEALSADLIARIGGDWWSFGKDLRALALSDDWPAIPEPLEIVLQIRHRRLAAIPWEVLRSPDDELLSLDERTLSLWRGSDESSARSTEARAIQGVLNSLSPQHELQFDGIMGPMTRDAIVKFQTAAALPATGLLDTATTAELRKQLAASKADLRPHAIIVRPTFGSQRTRLRGEYREGSDVAFEYQVSGFQTHVLEDVSLQELRDVITRHALSNEGPTILHLSAGITISSGTLSLDFGGDTGFTKSSRPRDGEFFTATSLDRLIQANRRSAWGPIVVLDVPRPTGHFEAQRLLLLRNLFATDLFQLGGSSAVIAAGLAEYESSRARARLLHTLGGGGSLADAVRDVRDLSRSVRDDRDGFTEALAFASTALFTDVPWMGAFAP
jgi:peptidoglycan hydrolase-like protein with peptidoglycan-binding domain